MRITTRPPTRLVSLTLLLGGAMLLVNPATAEAQFLKEIKERAKEAAEGETLNQVDMLVRGKVQCVFNDLACVQSAADAGDEYVLTDPEGEVLVDDEGMPVSDIETANEMMGGAAAPADLSTMQTGAIAGLDEADANFDFVAGDRVILDYDYEDDQLGDFPRGFDLIMGTWDIVEWNGSRWLRNIGPRNAAIAIPLPEALPDMFTIEFEAFLPHGNWQFILATASPSGGGTNPGPLEGNVFQVGAAHGTGVISFAGGPESKAATPKLTEAPQPVRIMVDGQHAKVFVGDQRVTNLPNGEFVRSDRLYLRNTYAASEQQPILIGAIRVAAGGRDLYDVLEREGRFTARGILFVVNSAEIRPESSSVLQEIGSTLQEHPDLRLSIQGHTDGDGDEAYNQELSERRAAAVRRYLIDGFGIEAARLETTGFGESTPVAPNDTAEGKQQNRRVELVKL